MTIPASPSSRSRVAWWIAAVLGGCLASAPAAAIDVAGTTTARFNWTPATGPVASYAVFVNRNGAGFPATPEQVVTAPDVTLQGTLNETIVVRVHARDAQGNLGPASVDSDPVRFVAAPRLALSSSSVNLTVSQGQTLGAQTFTVRNTGGGTLSYTIADDVTWMSVSPASGTATTETDTITVSFATSGLAPGAYTGRVTVSAAGATGAPAVYTVNLTVLQGLSAPGKPTLVQAP